MNLKEDKCPKCGQLLGAALVPVGEHGKPLVETDGVVVAHEFRSGSVKISNAYASVEIGCCGHCGHQWVTEKVSILDPKMQLPFMK
jgi:hypothetical protein